MTAPLPPDARVVVVGTGQGGFQLAASLRQEGFAGSVTLIGEEPGLPYQRPPLSKAYMADGDAERLLLKPAGFYARSALTLIDRTRASRIDRDVRTVHTADGAAHPYDHLVLATGARPFRPPVEGLDGPDTVELRTLADAALLRGRLARTRHAIVIGGGLLGFEIGAGLTARLCPAGESPAGAGSGAVVVTRRDSAGRVTGHRRVTASSPARVSAPRPAAAGARGCR